MHPSTKFGVRTSKGSAMRVLTDRHTDRQMGLILLPQGLVQEVTIRSSLELLGDVSLFVINTLKINEYILYDSRLKWQ